VISFEVADALTGEVTVVRQNPHDAQKLYMALREVFGDAQYQTQPGQLITVPSVSLHV
jgi:hypothetical protein